MRNNCDVSGKYIMCTHQHSSCSFFESVWPDLKEHKDTWCVNYRIRACMSTAAIRAAIEIEKQNEK